MYEDEIKLIEDYGHPKTTQQLLNEHRTEKIEKQISRITNGLKLYEKDRVQIQEFKPHEIIFQVRGSNKNVYEVILEHGKTWLCTCDDHNFRLGTCKHIISCILFLALKRREGQIKLI